MLLSPKPILWMGDSLERLRDLPSDVRSEVGHQLELVQGGENPKDFRPMPGVGLGTMEIRAHAANEYRVL